MSKASEGGGSCAGNEDSWGRGKEKCYGNWGIWHWDLIHLHQFQDIWVCPMYPSNSKILPWAPAKSGGKECLLWALPQGQTPGKNSWDYLVLSEMDLEPPWLKRDVALDWGCQGWSAASGHYSQNFCPCCSTVWISFLFSSLFIAILKNRLLLEALLIPIQN